MFKEFDPLDGASNLHDSFVEESKKRHIKNILKSYVGMFDVFSETIQNALDSIERRQLSENILGQVLITVNLDSNQFSIVDNGTGFSEKEFSAFLAPEVSFNKGLKQGTRGNKGVGATYLAYAYNKLFIETRSNEFQVACEFLQGRNWVEDEAGNFDRPKVRESLFKNPHFESFDRGASFTIEFGCPYSRPKGLDYFQAVTPKQWAYLLRAKTPLGLLSKKKKNISCVVSVVKSGQVSSINADTEYPFPHDVIASSLNIDDFKEWQRTTIEKGRDVSNIPAKFRKKKGLYKFYTEDDLTKLIKINPSEVLEFVDQYKIWAYGYFAHSTDVWDLINDDIFELRKGYRLIRGGLQLANNTMIQGESLVIPLSSNIGYQNQSHIIVHFTNADPDLGRKGFQPELKTAAERISTAIVGDLKQWRQLLKENIASRGEDDKEADLYQWLASQKEYQVENPLKLKSEHFFKPKNEVSILSVPQSEQDVIALFNQLLAGGVIRSVELLGTSQRQQYDGVFQFKVTNRKDLHLYDAKQNPLGVDDPGLVRDFVSPPKVLEYKHNVDYLIQEFHNEEKRAKDISLAVAWVLGDRWKEDYECVSYLDPDNFSHRKFHGITHNLKNSTSSIDVIVLSELIEYLNDPVASLATQARYVDA